MSSRSRNLGQIVQGIHTAQQNLSTLINRTLDPMGLNMSQLTVLSYFSNRPNRCQTITSITAAVNMNQPAVTKIVSYLMSEGWLTTEPDPAMHERSCLRSVRKVWGWSSRHMENLLRKSTRHLHH